MLHKTKHMYFKEQYIYVFRTLRNVGTKTKYSECNSHMVMFI